MRSSGNKTMMVLTSSDTPDFSRLRLGLCWLLKPPHEYVHTLSLKLPQFCCFGRHSFGEDSPLFSLPVASHKSFLLPPLASLCLWLDPTEKGTNFQVSTTNWHLLKALPMTKAFAICLCGGWTLWCCSCWPSTPPQVLQGGKRNSVRPPQTTISLFAFLFPGDDFDQHLLYNVKNLHP